MNIPIKYLIISTCLALGLISPVTAAEVVIVEAEKVSVDDAYEMMKSLAAADRKELVAKNLKLNSDESKAFWPIYNEYRFDMEKVNDRTFNLIKDYAANYQKLTDDKAEKLLNEHLKIKRSALKVKEKYLPRFRKAIPSKKVARFYQVDNKLDAVAKVRISEQVPLVK